MNKTNLRNLLYVSILQDYPQQARIILEEIAEVYIWLHALPPGNCVFHTLLVLGYSSIYYIHSE
jgi:hypothetical protein